MRKNLFILVLLVLVVGVVGYIWLQPRPSADWSPSVAARICPIDRTAVVTVVQLQSENGVYRGANLVAYNQYGEALVRGTVEVVWRRSWNDPVENKVGYTGSFLTVDRDLHYGLYTAQALQEFAADAKAPETIGIDSLGKTIYYKGLTGTSVADKSVVPISALKGGDGKQAALGLVSAENAPTPITCQKENGGVENSIYANTLLSLEQVGGGGKILFTDAVVSGDMMPVDSEAHQYRIAAADEFGSTNTIYPPIKDPIFGQAVIEPSVEVMTFSKGKTGRYWWLALEPRPKGVFNVHVTGLSGYGDDWAKLDLARTVVPSSLPASYLGIDPLAIAAVQASGVPLTIIQGQGSTESSEGTHEAEPDSPYTASVDFGVSDVSQEDIQSMLHELRRVGFAAWYRPTVGDPVHIHAVYTGVCKLKASTEAQVQSFLAGGNGLDNPGLDAVMLPTPEERQAVARVHANPQCANTIAADTTVTQTGSGNTLHPLTVMDGMYSGYFGSYNPDGYYGSLPVGHWDVSFDRNRIIPAQAFLQGASGKAGIPITSASPDALGDDCEGECLVANSSHLTATYGVYMMTGPWQDVFTRGYVPNGGSSEMKIAEFEYEYDKPQLPITIDYNFSGLTEEQRRTGYKWGISIGLIGNNPSDSTFNDVIYMSTAAKNTLDLQGEPLAVEDYFGLGVSGIIPLENNSVYLSDEVTDRAALPLTPPADDGDGGNPTTYIIDDGEEPSTTLPDAATVIANLTDFFDNKIQDVFDAMIANDDWKTVDGPSYRLVKSLVDLMTQQICGNPTIGAAGTGQMNSCPKPNQDLNADAMSNLLAGLSAIHRNYPNDSTQYQLITLLRLRIGEAAQNTNGEDGIVFIEGGVAAFTNNLTNLLLDTRNGGLSLDDVYAMRFHIYQPPKSCKPDPTDDTIDLLMARPCIIAGPGEIVNPEVLEQIQDPAVVIPDGHEWFTEPTPETDVLPILVTLPEYAPEPEVPVFESVVDDLLNQSPDPVVYHDPYVEAEFIYVPPTEPLFNDLIDYVTPMDYLETVYIAVETVVEKVVDQFYPPLVVVESYGVTTAVPELPQVPAPTVVETITASVAAIPDQIVAFIQPEPENIPVPDLPTRTATQLFETKARVGALTTQQKELKSAITVARKSRDKAAIKELNKQLTAVKRAARLEQRTLTNQNQAYVAFTRARNQLTALRLRDEDKPTRALKRKIVVAERTYVRAEIKMRKVFGIYD